MSPALTNCHLCKRFKCVGWTQRGLKRCYYSFQYFLHHCKCFKAPDLSSGPPELWGWGRWGRGRCRASHSPVVGSGSVWLRNGPGHWSYALTGSGHLEWIVYTIHHTSVTKLYPFGFINYHFKLVSLFLLAFDCELNSPGRVWLSRTRKEPVWLLGSNRSSSAFFLLRPSYWHLGKENRERVRNRKTDLCK